MNELDEVTFALPEDLAVSSNTTENQARNKLWFLSGRMGSSDVIRYVPIHCTPFQIGRQAHAGLTLECRSVSSLHAEFIEDGESLTLRDLGSTNGTYVNGRRIVEPVQVRENDLVQFANIACRVLQQATVCENGTICEDVVDQAMALVQFDRLMSEQAVVPHYQPLVRLQDDQTIGYEVLARSHISGLETPGTMFSAASQFSVESQLSQMIRCKAIHETRSLLSSPQLFLNTHPAELEGGNIVESLRSMRELSRSQPLTLEIHEKAAADGKTLQHLRSVLRELNIRLAFDDFGAGQARLIELAEVQPHFLKFDISLIRGLDAAPKKHQDMVASLVAMSRNMGIVPLAEGIETQAEKDICVTFGFELGQGFYFGRPTSLQDYHSDGHLV